jgi:hypothetical protein
MNPQLKELVEKSCIFRMGGEMIFEHKDGCPIGIDGFHKYVDILRRMKADDKIEALSKNAI